MGKAYTKVNWLVLFIISCLLYANTNAQVGQNNFKYLHPTPTSITYLDVSFYDNNNGIAVGNGTGIAKTTDGGLTWQYGTVMFNTATGFKQRPTFQDVHFVTPTIVYAVGDSGMMMKSTDAGLNWTQINNPLYGNARSINAVWFINKDTGYIGGQAQNLAPTSADSLNSACAPKLYFTRNGGTTWDSIAAPRGAMSWVGLVQNTINPPIKVPVNALNKEIYRIQFVNDSVGYIIGSGSGTSSGFPQAYPGTTAGSTVTNTFAANLGSLIWKFNKGVLTDYSLTKEKLGYSGVAPFGTPPTATTTYNTTTAPQQSLKAMIPLNDSVLIVHSFNNGVVTRIRTGVNDSTVLSHFNPATLPGAIPAVTGGLTGLPTARGKYELLQYNNAPTTPLTYNQAALPVLPPYTILNSNCVNAKRAPDGKWYFTTSGGKVISSPDNGVTWTQVQAVPATHLATGYQMFALDITPNGRIHEMGTNGVHTYSNNGTTWTPNYNLVAASTTGQLDIDFADCNNGVVVGNPGLVLATTNGGVTWQDRTIASLANSLVAINGVSLSAPNAMHFVGSNGSVYFSTDMGTTNNLLLSPLVAGQGYDVATFGSGPTTRIWVTGHRFSPPNEKSIIYRSLNNGLTWDSAKSFFPQGTLAANLNQIKFVDGATGYVSGSKGTCFKTTDAGATWTNISPVTINPLLSTGSQNSIGVFGNTIYYWTLAFSTNPNIRFLHKSTDGGATWSANLFPITVANEPTSNVPAIIVHDANNVVLTSGPSKIMITNDGGATWRFEEAPSGGSFNGATFLPKTVPAGTPLSARKLILAGSGAILEFGVPAAYMSSTETVTQASCSNPAGGSITINATGSVAPYSYSINGGAYQASNVFSLLSTGTYTVRIRSSACDTILKNITIGFNNNLTLTASNDTAVCAGAPVQLQASGNAVVYSWTPAAGLSATNIPSPVAIVNTPTTYTLTASLNTCSLTKNITISIKPNPLVDAGPDFTIVVGDDQQLQGSGANNIANITWSPSASIISGGATLTPTVKPTATTTYTLTVKDANNCTSTDQAVVTVIPYCVKVTEAFTPNGDGINDKWIVTTGAACTKQVLVNVYNRYGSPVFESSNYNNNWDGTYKGKPVPDGTYYYKITYRLINNQTVLQQGNITILR